ncbi:hypothetical protein BJF93_07015 [Xaviernesmea oryzae]|uniref:Uncharacterized protein n=1 Tax=Xaviernesmea oryzae TaxID=464029 RepID=A0A1Q9ASE8_9HYPH|nr:hypothetical protein [Xaviernesmea oryzae]OLP58344.1 hypothetical protein BJF93_07015 [Xaviernesmea oryzae]SEL41115.1 hypothetical protein SAMN04487976_10811 [Xaviernesmea oryzae]
MSSQNNNAETAGLGIGFAFIAIAALLVFALASFLAMILTLIALCAWFRPITIAGATIEPEEARWFVYRGLIGIVTLPAFAAFSSLLFQSPFDWSRWLVYLMIGGYVGGSLGIALLRGEEQQPTEITAMPASIPPQLPKPTPKPKPQMPDPDRPECRDCPFTFANWDDREEAWK